MKHQLSESLRSRTFLGLLLAQFTTTFNDQAIHMVAVFYAVDMLVRFVAVRHIDDKAVVSIVTACFITPFLLFSPYAGVLGDKFSKRSVIVFWKVAEVAMMALALLGLGLPHLVGVDSPHIQTAAVWSAVLVIATVFLMGLHSTFFVPAKLGAMPEILHPSILSRGNGFLEGTSFAAQIMGTSAGGILYSLWKGNVSTGRLQLGREWMIGVILFCLALVGTGTALLMRRIPVAAADRKISWSWWQPLRDNLSILWRSKPLTLSVTGIAFCVFMTLFLRQTLLFQGELTKELRSGREALAASRGEAVESKPTGVDRLVTRVLPKRLEKAAQESELRVALLFALVGLGVGGGSVLAGFLSGHRVELGLVPIGALMIIAATFSWAAYPRPGLFVACLFVIGIGAGFYLVPLYTLLQHRAPKENKGNVVAASNFLNVVGGIVAVAAFYFMTFALDKMLGAELSEYDVRRDPSRLPQFVEELERQLRIPRVLFLATSVMTLAATWVLMRRMPDFLLRTLVWLRSGGRNTLRTIGLEHMPLDGPVLLATNCRDFDAALNLIAALDRYSHIILFDGAGTGKPHPVLHSLARRAGMISLSPATMSADDWDRVLNTGSDFLRRSDMVTISVGDDSAGEQIATLVGQWSRQSAAVLPVCCTTADTEGRTMSRPQVIIGSALPPQASLETIRAAIEHLAISPPLETEHG
jgi:MFS family permease